MIKSMTGFSAITREDEWATMTVTIRALNHRYLDLQLRIPQALAAIEPAVRARIGRARQGGLVDGALTPGDLLRLPQALTIRERQTDADETVEQALAERA